MIHPGYAVRLAFLATDKKTLKCACYNRNMREVDLPAFRLEIMRLLDRYSEKITNIVTSDDTSMISFDTHIFGGEIELSEKWLGYEFVIFSKSEDILDVRLEGNLDGHPFQDGTGKKAALGLFDDLLKLLQDLFESKLYFKLGSNESYVAQWQEDGKFIYLK